MTKNIDLPHGLRQRWTTLTIYAVLIIFSTLSFRTASAHVISSEDEPLCTNSANGPEECNASYSKLVDYETANFDPATDNDHDGEADGEDFGEEVDEDEDEEGDYEEENEDWSPECLDRYDDCQELADENECESNPGYMHFQCPESCNTCDEYTDSYERGEWPPCTDKVVDCKSWAASGECAYNTEFMQKECQRSCMTCFVDTNQFGISQSLPSEDDEHYSRTVQVIDESIEYMKKLWSDSNPDKNRINYKCRNMESDCSFWAALGECQENSDYMKINCAPACQSCELLDIRLKCPITEDNKMVYKPGELNALMERIVDNSDGKGTYLQYNPKAISRPKIRSDGTAAPGVEVDGPWIVLFENFVSEAEAEALIAAGAKKGYERSADVGAENPDGSHEEDVNDGRTSYNAWCDEELCNDDPIIGPVIQRIANVTETPVENSEDLQLLRYEPGQYYRQHHDYIEYQEDLPLRTASVDIVFVSQ
eukprot:CCRYP_020080-RA/>CCRYP_020080-RA protein AED:0.17 eAED:0.17 QI:302/1/1/1/0.5/0.33/3/416/480